MTSASGPGSSDADTLEYIAATVRRWIDDAEAAVPGTNVLSELRSRIAGFIRENDAEALTRLSDWLTPAAAVFRDRLEVVDVPDWIVKGAALPVLSGLVATAISQSEWNDPGAAIATLTHGPAVLKALAADIPANDRNAFIPLRLDEFRKRCRLSDSVLSRTIAALEEARLVHRVGATRSRQVTILPRGWAWLDSQPNLTLIPEPPALEEKTPSTIPGDEYRRKVLAK